MPAKLTKKEIDARLAQKNIKILEQYINIRTKYLFQCLNKNCESEWITTPNTILTMLKEECQLKIL